MLKKSLIYLLLLGCPLGHTLQGQVNFLGKPGYMATPSAEWFTGRPLGLSFSYLPREYSIFNSPADRNTVNFYNARLSFTSFMEVNLNIAYRPLIAERIGIGDRQLDFRFRLFRETESRPAIVLGWTPPASTSPVMAHDYIVATKNFRTGIGNFSLSGGYGSPYIIRRNPKKEGFLDSIELTTKSEFGHSEYLEGFFGGLSYLPVRFGGLMLEYDTRTLNAGAFISVNEWLLLQAYTYEAKRIAFHFAFHFPLDFAPRALRSYEKDLD